MIAQEREHHRKYEKELRKKEAKQVAQGELLQGEVNT
jgi:hypothetical protein